MDDSGLIDKLSRRYFLYFLGGSLLGGKAALSAAQTESEADDEVVFGSGRLEVACARFDCTPPVGLRAPTLGEHPFVQKIEGPLETRVFSLRQGELCIGWANSDYDLFEQFRHRLAAGLNIPYSRTLISVTHNHSTLVDTAIGDSDKTGFSQRFYSNLDHAIGSLNHAFVPASVSWATGRETEITYNRKGHRPDGSTYFMREDDRIKLPGDFTGVIDPTASVIRFDRPDGRPMLFVTNFTGHPVIAYNLEAPVINPDFCGWAIIDLEKAYAKDNATGVFLQGCAGDINAKGMFSGAKLARESGDKLGKVFIEASQHTRKVGSPDLSFATGMAYVPYAPLPSLEELEKEKQELLDYVKRVDAGDPDTLHVLGYNFSPTIQLKYRHNLATPFLRWTDWAIEMQKEGKPLPVKNLPVQVHVVSIGDIALAVMPHELFSGIGLSIRKRSPFACTIPVAYSNHVPPNYIGTDADVGSKEYMSAFYRYTLAPRYDHPAGNVIADKTVDLLNKLKARAKTS